MNNGFRLTGFLLWHPAMRAGLQWLNFNTPGDVPVRPAVGFEQIGRRATRCRGALLSGPGRRW
jgi:hypothetical protein